MADKDYLENWRELYSYPNHITSNEYLTEDGDQSTNSQNDWTYAQEHILLKGNAIGTAKNDFLDPIPLFNKLGHIYTNIINSYFTSARTDAIKVGLKNMDFTNGRNLEDMPTESIPLYDFFNFYDFVGDDINHKNFYNPSTQSDNTNGNAIASMRQRLKIYETDGDGYYDKFCIIDENFFNSIVRFKYGVPVYVREELVKYTNWYTDKKEEIMDVFSKIKDLKWEQYWTKIQYTYMVDNIKYTDTYFVPSTQYISVWLLYCGALNGTQKGLQLLMPQYKRRVEVEDLNKNFWVISQILDAVVNALWGPYGLIDVVRQLILRVLQIEKFLGLDGVEKIELLVGDSDDLYFDMYSRFDISNVQLRLKGSHGERIIKNIFENNNETNDRYSTTDADNDTTSLIDLFNLVEGEIYTESFNIDGKTVANPYYGKIFDSDLIVSTNQINFNNTKKGYLTLSTVIDAINNRIVEGEIEYGEISYKGSNQYQIFKILDPNGDGILTSSEISRIIKDSNKNLFSQILLNKEQFLRLSRYREAYSLDLKDDEVNYFDPVDVIISSDSIGSSDDALLTFIKQWLKDFERILKYFVDDKKEYSLRYQKITDVIDEETSETMNSVEGVSELEYWNNLANEYEQMVALCNFTGGTQSYKIKNGGNIYQNFILPTNKNEISIKLSQNEDIYAYNYIVAIAIARYLCMSNENKSNFIKSLGTKVEDIIPYLDVDSSQELNVSDCAKIAAIVANNSKNSLYYLKATEAYSELQKIGENTSISKGPGWLKFVYELLKKCLGEEGNADNIANALGLSRSDALDYIGKWAVSDAMKELFIPKGKGILNFQIKSTMYIPNENLINKLTSKGLYESQGSFVITPKDKQSIINSTKNTEYKLRENILIFLYDNNYYQYRGIGEEIDNMGLYTRSIDAFYKNSQPLIKKSDVCKRINGTDCISLFIPRNDLINGEIIQLRMTEKGKKKYYLDFNYLNNENGFSTIKECSDTKGKNLFLSLHNSFSNFVANNNTRTTLFFKDTVPEWASDDNKGKSLKEWFCNGIECFYFKPRRVYTKEGNTLYAKDVKNYALKIYASMIAKRDDFIDNSFISNNLDRKENGTGLSSYLFDRQMAYCAAIRHNLIFYGSAAMDEKNQFIHSPLQLLQSQQVRGNSETIQTHHTVGYCDADIKIPWDCLPQSKKTCTLNEIKNMLYLNTKDRAIPMMTEAIFGSRYVNEYVKWKKVKYIVIERETRARNYHYGPTGVGVSMGIGYLHRLGDQQKTIKSCYEGSHYTHKVIWYNKNGEIVPYNTDGYIPETAEFGVVDLSKIKTELEGQNFYNMFAFRFYSGNPHSTDFTKTEFSLPGDTDNSFSRRPIFRMAYFFGESEEGTSNQKHNQSAVDWTGFTEE